MKLTNVQKYNCFQKIWHERKVRNSMIKGIGMDLIEIERIEKSLAKSNRLANRVLTRNEKETFKQFQSERRRAEFLAGRFSAKEAFAKATGRGIGKLSFQDIEIISDLKGAPSIKAVGYEGDRIFVSITHSHHYAAAQVVIEDK